MKKYRPYLTLDQLKHLLMGCTDFETSRYLDRFIRDIDEGWRKANMIVADPISVRLGIKEGEKQTSYELEQQNRYMSDQMTPEEELAYELKIGVPRI